MKSKTKQTHSTRKPECSTCHGKGWTDKSTYGFGGELESIIHIDCPDCTESKQKPKKRVHGLSRMEKLLERSIAHEAQLKKLWALFETMDLRLQVIENRANADLQVLTGNPHVAYGRPLVKTQEWIKV